MKKYRIQFQKTMYGGNDVIDYNKQQVYSQIINCDRIEEFRKNPTEINEINIEKVKELGLTKKSGEEYKIGDLFESPTEEIHFFKDSQELPIPFHKQRMFADPYFKLEMQKEDGSWETILEHECSSCNHKKNLTILKLEDI